MFRRTKVSAGVVFALGVMGAAGAWAQAQQLERVEITGSSIKRVAAEGALPVQTLKREDIERSGVTSVVELMQNLAVVQGGYTEGDAIGGGGGGLAEVSIHNQGGDRTLVLLNGRRLVGEAGGAVDLNMIPLSAIERVEVLTDGASAIYGSDAVAGVVNFITRRNTSMGGLELRASIPQRSGGKETNFGISKGIGNVDSDGYNVLLSASFDKRDSLSASQRSFSKTGNMFFDYGGQHVGFFNGSPRSIPGNVVMPDGSLANIYEVQNGECPPGHVDYFGSCYNDYAATVMGLPTRDRASFMANSVLKISPDHELKFDAYYTKTKTKTLIASVPGELSIDPNGPLGGYLNDIGWAPYTDQDGFVHDQATVYYRATDLGGREATYKRDSFGAWLGAEGRVGGWDYSTSVGAQQTKYKEFNKGYPFGKAFNELMNSGVWNPFVLRGNQSQAALDAAAGIMTDGFYDGERSRLYSLEAKASREIFQLPGGAASIALGANYNQDAVDTDPSAVARGVAGPTGDDSRFGDAGAAIAYSAKRKAFGVFGELLLPVAKSFEIGAALRYDNYKDIDSAVTGKVSFRYQPNNAVLFRGSLGTGFRAPTLRQLYRPLQQFGVTGTPFACTPEMQAIATGLGAQCRPAGTQYDVFTGGDANIKPEESRQATIGFRVEPTSSFSFGADLWWIGIKNTFGTIDETEAFSNAAKYSDFWTSYTDPVSGQTYLAYAARETNLGKSYSSGVDLDIVGRFATDVGPLTSSLRATYMIRDRGQLLPNGEYFSTVGDNNPSIGEVTFRWKATWSNTLQMGNWTHTAAVNFLSGYKDFPGWVDFYDDAGNWIGEDQEFRMNIKRFSTLDWQTSYAVNKALQLTVGVKNVFDRSPPLTLRTTGAHMLGFDYRYYNPLGRTFQAKLNYAF
ncbi:TonB-dependent receptor plug domain-containing protein [Piscinibacter sp.]|uniref:TonB-dependent receptor plug domain-containing protein n=1 Tax=Piscinibacter sp. TaxID=1903157 RepID=UPI0039E2E82C